MEKTGEIKEGVTPPEEKLEGEKQAKVASLEEHLTKRTSDHAATCCGGKCKKE